MIPPVHTYPESSSKSRQRLNPWRAWVKSIARFALLLLLTAFLSGVYQDPSVQNFSDRYALFNSIGAFFQPENLELALNASETPLPGQPTSSPLPASLTPTANITSPPTQEPLHDLPIDRHDFPSGLMVISLQEGKFSHLFLFHPETLPMTRITSGEWHDIAPALSPNGHQIAFSSNRGGKWDLYLLDLDTGEIIQITDSPEYEGAPTWSPDGMFLAYERYTDENMEIFVRSMDNSIEPISLSSDPGGDYAPDWSPLGRQIAFVSTRSGEPEIWLADLDRIDDRFTNLSLNPDGLDIHPAWSPDGHALAWASISNGQHNIHLWEINQATKSIIGSGDFPVWNPAGDILLTTVETPRNTYLTAYKLQPRGLVALPTIPLPGSAKGLLWGDIRPPKPLPNSLLTAAQITPSPLWVPSIPSPSEIPNGRQTLVNLPDVIAPHPQMQDIADEAFFALRNYIIEIAGWDFLSTLENAYVPLTSPLLPGSGNNWLYTGRAIAVNPAPLSAGWMKVVREDFGHQTYWRVYLRTRFQDGSQGKPMLVQPWDLNARNNGNTRTYEQGGSLESTPPSGYWIDFTEIASAFGWERLPALDNWRAFFQGARFNEFALRMGLDWQTAILELYPKEILITPSPIVLPSSSATPIQTSPPPTPTPVPFRTPTPTVSPTSVDTPSVSPTPSPTGSVDIPFAP